MNVDLINEYKRKVDMYKRTTKNFQDSVFAVGMSTMLLLFTFSMGKAAGRKSERENAKNKIEFMSKCNAELDNLFLCQSLREKR